MRILLIGERSSSSGLPTYLQKALESNGASVAFGEIGPSKSDRLFAAAVGFSFPKQRWFERYERQLYHSSWSWRRMTTRARRCRGKVNERPDWAVQIGGLFSCVPSTAAGRSAAFLTYTTRLALQDGTSPWRPTDRGASRFLARERELYGSCAYIFTSASYVRDDLVEHYSVSPERIVVTSMGVHEEFLRTPLPDSENIAGPTVLFVGRTFHLKGGPQLVAACQRVREGSPDLLLHVVGPRASEVPQEPWIRYHGNLSRGEIIQLMDECRVFAMPSLCDSFGFVFLEAMARGMPVLGANVNAMPEIIEGSGGGVVVDPHDVDAIANGVSLLLGLPPDARRAMGERGRDFVERTARWPIVGKRMLDIMRRDMS